MRARRIRTESTGLALWGMDDDPPPRPSESSPISGRLSSRTSRARCPQASVVATRASPARVIGRRWVCQEGAASQPEPLCERGAVLRRADGTADLDREGEAGEVGPRLLETRSASRATLSPKVIGSAHCVSVRPIIGVVTVLLGQPARARPAPCARWSTDGRHGVAQQQHEGGVDDVLAGQAGVEVEVGMRRAQGLDQRDHGVAARARCPARRPVAASRSPTQARLDDDHRLEEGPVGEQVAGARVAGPEQ